MDRTLVASLGQLRTHMNSLVTQNQSLCSEVHRLRKENTFLKQNATDTRVTLDKIIQCCGAAPKKTNYEYVSGKRVIDDCPDGPDGPENPVGPESTDTVESPRMTPPPNKKNKHDYAQKPTKKCRYTKEVREFVDSHLSPPSELPHNDEFTPTIIMHKEFQRHFPDALMSTMEFGKTLHTVIPDHYSEKPKRVGSKVCKGFRVSLRKNTHKSLA